jgi:uncharacterized protein (DUF2267 family)
MSFSDLTTMLLNQSAFRDAEDAELALTTTLETLGYLLPARLVRELEGALPDRCGWPLSFGRSVSENLRRAERGLRRRELAELPGETVERIQEVCAVLGRELPPALIQDIVCELPQQLRGAFYPRIAPAPLAPARALRGTLASGRPGSLRPVSEARVGGLCPIGASRPASAQAGSVSEANPHADSKLSSARGTMQEREHETLATALPKY